MTIPFLRPRTTLGIDLGAAYLKTALINHAHDTPQLVKATLTPITPHLLEGITKDAAGHTVAIALKGPDAIVKYITLDRVPAQEAGVAIDGALQVHFNPSSDVQIDAQLLNPDSATPTMNVIAAAVKRSALTTLLQTYTEAQITPTILNVEPIATHNALAANHEEAMHGVVAIANIGHHTTDIHLASQGNPVAFHTALTGMDTIHKANAQLESDQGLSDSYTVQSTLSPNHPLRIVSTDIQRTVAALPLIHNTPSVLRTVYICGGGACIPSIRTQLAHLLACPVHLLNPFAHLHIRDDAFGDIAIDDVAPIFATAVGLALHPPHPKRTIHRPPFLRAPHHMPSQRHPQIA